MTDWDSALKSLPPDDTQQPALPQPEVPKAVQPRSKWDDALERLDANQLLQANPEFTGTMKQFFRMVGQGTLRGFAETLGTPVDTMNGVADFIRDYPEAARVVGDMGPAGKGILATGAVRGLVSGDERIETGSTPSIRKGIESTTGLSTKSAKEEGITDTSAEFADLLGEFGGSNLPFLPLAPVKALGPAFKTAMSAPKETALSVLKEMGIGAAAPATGALVGMHAAGWLDPKAEDLGKGIGALAGNLRYKLAETAIKGGKSASAWMHDFLGFGTGAKLQAGKALAATTQDLPEAINQLNKNVELSPGARIPVDLKSGDEGLIALRQSVAARNAELAGDYQKMQRATEEALLEDARLSPANFPDTQSWLAAKQQALEAAASARVRQAVDEAEAYTAVAMRGSEAGVEGTAAKQQASTYLRRELLNAQDDMDAVTRARWEQVDQTLPVDMTPVYDRANALRSEHAGRAGQAPESFPGRVINRLFDEEGEALFGPGTPLRTVIDLDSSIQREIRLMQANDAPDAVYISYLSRLSEALNETKRSIPGAENNAALRDALNATRTYHDTFTRGPVGQVLGYDRAGGVDISPGNTIKTFMSQGPGGIDSFNALMRAVAQRTGAVAPIHPTAEMGPLMERYIRQDFFEKASGRDGFNVPAAQKWMQNNAGPMQSFPQLQREFDAAIRTQGQARRVEETTKQELNELRKSRAALFLNGEPGPLFNGALSGPNKGDATRELIRMTRDDPSGRATEGLAQMALDNMIARAIVPDRSSQILQRVDGLAVNRWLNENHAVVKALDEAIPGIAKRFERIGATAHYLERFQISSRIPTPEESDAGGWLRTVMARIGGANVFAKFSSGGGSSIQTAAIGSQAFKKIAAALTPDQATALVRQALLDKQLFEDLTRNWTKAKPEEQIKAIGRLSPYLYSIGIPIAQPYLNPPEEKKPRARPTAPVYDEVPTLGVP